MNRLLQFVLVSTTFLAVSAPGSEPIEIPSAVDYFEGTFKEALEQAKESDQSLFVYFYIPDCAACEYMYFEFQGAFVGRFLNDRFTNYKINASNEEASDPELIAKFNVDSYPTYLIIDHDGKEKHRATGAMEREIFKRTISWLTGETEFPMAEDDAKYEVGERDPVFVQQYLLDARIVLPKNLGVRDLHMKAWGQVKDKYTAIANEYLASQEPEDLVNSRDLSIIKAYSNNIDDPGVKLVLNHFDAFVEATSIEQVSRTVLEVAYNTVIIRAFDRAVDKYAIVIDDIAPLDEESLRKATDWLRNFDEESLLKLEENFLFNVRQILTETEGSIPNSED